MSNSRSMRRKMAGVTGTSARKKDQSKNLRRMTRHATEALEGTLAGLADRFGPKPEPEADADGSDWIADGDAKPCVSVECPPVEEIEVRFGELAEE